MELRIVIERSGSLIVAVSGAPGATCLQMTEAFEEEMGKVINRQRTGEFYGAARVALTAKTRETA